MVVTALFLYSPMECSLCSSLQAQILLYLAIPFLSSDLALLCYPTGTKSKGFFVFPPCYPRSMDNMFKSSHIIHSCSTYLILSRIVFIFSYVSFICIECPIGMKASLLPLCNKTHFMLLLELSMNSLHSNGM